MSLGWPASSSLVSVLNYPFLLQLLYHRSAAPLKQCCLHLCWPRKLTLAPAVLFLYHRIFPSRTFRNVLLAVGAIVFSWAMSAFFPSIFSCYPIEKTWDSTIPGRCIDYGIVTLAIGILNVIMDFAILGLPMPLVWKLRMSTRRKAYLSAIFGVGCM